MDSRRLALAPAAALAVALLLTGCAGRGGPAASRTPLPTPSLTATATSTPGPTVEPTATPEQTPSIEPTATAEPPAPGPTSEPTASTEPEPATMRCDGSDLSLEYVPDPDASGAGSSAFDLVFTNIGPSTCTLAGIPGVYATDADGVRLGHVATATGPNPEGLLPLLPAQRADVRVTWHSPGAFGCPVATSSYLVAEVVDAADSAVRAPAAIEVCTDDTAFMEATTYTLLG